jgi:S-adenosylmethionine:tRNA ribosyltransferase-isomerase
VNAAAMPALRGVELEAADAPRADPLAERLLVIDPSTGSMHDQRIADLPRALRAGDLLVLNDAATLPASLRGSGPAGEPVELRLAHRHDDGAWEVVLFGDGDWRTRTEHRAPPPWLRVGDVVRLGDELGAHVVAVSERSPRLVTVRFSHEGDALWQRLYRLGRPVQYAHLRAPLALWDVQTPIASRPWAMEMPSAGRPLTWALLDVIAARGVSVARVTHAAGLSSTGDEALDASLPWPERWEVSPATAAAVVACRARGGRVIAVGTSVVRALEASAACATGAALLASGTAVTDLLLGEGYAPRVVDGVLTGMHERGSSHHALLTAFARAELLDAALRFARSRGYLQHEFGDSALVLRGAGEGRRA